MMIPSIDIQDGRAVQLIGGEKKAIDAGDPWPIAERFARVGEIAVIDLDAAMGVGENSTLIRELCAKYPCRVGGGIRDAHSAVRWLDSGAQKVILGTAATPEVLRELPQERVIAALDAREGRVVIEGWRETTPYSIEERMRELKNYVSGFLVTFVEHEGRMQGIPIERAKELSMIAGETTLTAAGGVRNAEDIAALDALGIDSQVGMAIYSGAMDLSEGITSLLRSDRSDGLWPTVVCDVRGETLGLVYSNAESVGESVRTGKAVYFSRSRNQLWRKGETSGNTQELVQIHTDCDRDALKFVVKQSGTGFCHTGSRSCFGEETGFNKLETTIRTRSIDAPPESYTRRLLDDPSLLRSKLLEEADELISASNPEEATHEAADLLFFALTRAIQCGSSLVEIERELDRRALKVTRRPGDAKPNFTGAKS